LVLTQNVSESNLGGLSKIRYKKHKESCIVRANKQYLLETDKEIVQVMKSKAIIYGTMILVGIVLGSLYSYFPFYYILPVAIIPVLFLLQIKHKYFLLLLLILGFVLFGRGFAHLGVEIGGLPLYITEVVLFITVAILLLDKFAGGNRIKYLKNIPLKKEFVLFYLIGFVALIRGFVYYTPLLTLRHSALFYYSIFYFLIPILFKDLRRIELLFKLVFVACTIIPIAILFKINFNINAYGGLGQSSYLYLSLAVIVESFYLISVKRRLHKFFLILIILLQLFGILIGQSRATWIALSVSFLFFLYLSLGANNLKQQMKKVFFSILLIGAVLLSSFAIARPGLFDKLKTEAATIIFFNRIENPSASNTRWRLYVWGDMLRELSKKPLFGWGFGKPFRSSTLESLGWERYEKEKWTDPHNSHLNIAYKTGIIGFSIFLLIIMRFLGRTMRLLRRMRQDDKIKLYIMGLLTCFVHVLILALFVVALEGPYLGAFLWIAMGLIVALENIYKKREAENTLGE